MKYTIKMTLANGYEIRSVEAKNFGEACLILFKEASKKLKDVKAFEIV
jgi:hypothetical protein